MMNRQEFKNRINELASDKSLSKTSLRYLMNEAISRLDKEECGKI